ncbi:LPS export ABC transporter periplasmic protein LptC [Flavobacteriales bacterium]|jgi:LPS export ABC transporter protein LptC|nr:LPS export ABC transporter periplasmic protein LptC [Flavobacteriales bacterium]MDB2362038.1 LPS export ABC transporter periplasmic protein LptC [Flavobacteriales bacterium]
MFLFSCSNDLETIKEISIQNQSVFPVETIKDCEIIYSDSSKVRVLLSAAIMNRFNHEKKYVEIEDGLKVQFFDESGKKESELLSDYAIIDEENDVMQAQKNVVVRNVNGDVLESETLNWSQEKQEIFTDDFIKITTANEVIYGQGLVSNQNFTKYTIKKIKGTISIDR